MTAPDPSLEAAETAFREVLAESPARAAVLLVDIHPADAVEWLRDTEDRDRSMVFGALSPTCQASILEHADEALTQELIAPLDARLLTQVLEELPSDEAADVLIEADDRVANDALERLSPATAESLRTLLSFDPESAGGIMATDFVVTQPGERIGDVVKSVRKGAEDIEPDVGVFVLDQQRRPIGYLSDRALLTHTIHSPVEEVMCEPFVVAVDEDQEGVEADRALEAGTHRPQAQVVGADAGPARQGLRLRGHANPGDSPRDLRVGGPPIGMRFPWGSPQATSSTAATAGCSPYRSISRV